MPGHRAPPGRDSSHPKTWTLPWEDRSCPSETPVLGGDASVSESTRGPQGTSLEQVSFAEMGRTVPAASRTFFTFFHCKMIPPAHETRCPVGSLPFQMVSFRCQEDRFDRYWKKTYEDGKYMIRDLFLGVIFLLWTSISREGVRT